MSNGKQITTVYKVTKLNERSEPCSLLADPPIGTIFKPGQWHRARIGYFFAFENKDRATEFALTVFRHSDEIWRCQARVVKKALWIYPVPLLFQEKEGLNDLELRLENFWKKPEALHEKAIAPSGSLLVKHIKLIECIHNQYDRTIQKT